MDSKSVILGVPATTHFPKKVWHQSTIRFFGLAIAFHQLDTQLMCVQQIKPYLIAKIRYYMG